jgi:hypothetical protein
VLKLAENQFLPLCGSWDYEDWDEYDYSRIKSLKFRELAEARMKEGQNAVSKECLKCPNFLKHVRVRAWQCSQPKLTVVVRPGARSVAHQGKHPCSPPAHVRSKFTATP